MIRLATEADLIEAAEISKASMVYFWKHADFLQTIQNPQAIIFVSEVEGRLAGYAVFYHAADEGEIPSIAVSPDYRKRGVGGELLSGLLEEARSRGVRKIFLEVRRSNLPAHRLYEKSGFLLAGSRRNFYENPREDADILVYYHPA